MHELHDISDLDPEGLPSGRSLLKATLVALLLAVVLLVTVILPAEYGIDPTGVGARLGLGALHAVDQPPASAAPTGVADAGPVHKAAGAPRNDTLKLPLGPGQGAEIKAVMQAGQRFVFHWQADGGPVHFDMHGEPPDSGGSFTSYWIAEQESAASGAFVAPFDGTHGWYWENRGQEPVTIQLHTSGFYDTLFMP